MASLQNLQIDQSYAGLIKTANEQGGAPFPPAALQYGDGTNLPITIGDGSGIGLGDILVLGTGNRNIDINSQNLAINGLTNIDGQAGTATIVNGTFNFGLGFPGAPATNVDFTNANVTGLPSSGGGTNFVGSYWTLNTQASQDLVYETVTIPGGTYGVGDVINVQEIEYRDGLNNWGYSSLWISDTAQTVGQAPVSSANNFSIGQLQSPSSRYRIIYDKTLFITSAGTFVMPIQQSDQTSGSGGDPVEIYNINWANDQHFFFQLWNDSTAGSYQVSGVSITQRS